MRTSSIIAFAVAIGMSAASAPALLSQAQAESMANEGTSTLQTTGKSVTQAAGKLKTDATQTTKDVQALDVEKTAKGAGQVKQDAKDLHQSAKDTIKNPLGMTGK